MTLHSMRGHLFCYNTKMIVELETSWKRALVGELKKPYYSELLQRVQHEYMTHEVYPLQSDIFSAFTLCPFDSVQVVILGQDPYHGLNQAHGLAFSVQKNTPIPPSLQNIFKEIKTDTGAAIPTDGNLAHWAQQGVLLLNSVLTVRAGEAGSHRQLGWEQFTDAVITSISEEKDHIVFLLWGTYAQQKAKLIDNSKHLILTGSHPSPLSAYRGFFGCKHFSATDQYLMSRKKPPIAW